MLTDEKQRPQQGVPALMVPRFGRSQLLLGASKAEAPRTVALLAGWALMGGC